jgi:hypothetical protein
VIDIKPFVPAKDLERSKQFYTDLGFTVNWSGPDIAQLQIGSFRFLLQLFFVDAWWDYIERQEIAKKYPGIMCRPQGPRMFGKVLSFAGFFWGFGTQSVASWRQFLADA